MTCESVSPLELCRRLLALPQSVWLEYAFSRDPLCQKVPPAERRAMALEAVACGRECASRVKREFPTQSVEEIARAMGVSILRDGRPPGNAYFALLEDADTIRLFTPCLDAARELYQDPGLAGMLGFVPVDKLLTAHELFHRVEADCPDLYTVKTAVTLWRLGPLRHRSPLVCLSELGAMAFSADMMGLSYCPFVFDILLLLRVEPAAAMESYRRLASWGGVG